MTRCKTCQRPLHQQVEKALSGESAMVWADDEGGWVCPFGGNEHEPEPGHRIEPVAWSTVVAEIKDAQAQAEAEGREFRIGIIGMADEDGS